MINKSKHIIEYRNITISAIAMFLTICVLIFLATTQDKMNLRTARFGLQQNTIGQAGSMNTTIAYASSSIQLSAVTVSRELREADPEGMLAVIEELRDNSPFSDLYYINDNGIVVNSDQKTYIGERNWFKDGMKGEEGFIVDISPVFSDEPMLIFYSPIMARDEVVGVLIGTLRGSTSIRPFLTQQFNGQQLFGFILDANNGIVASNVDFQKGLVLNSDTLNIMDEEKDFFMSEIVKANGEAFLFACPNGDGIACVSYIGNTGLRIIQVLPADGLNKTLMQLKIYTYIAFGSIIFISVCVFLLIIDANKKRLQQDLNTMKIERDEQLSLLLSMAEVYYSMHLIDLKQNSYIEYTAHNQVKELGKKYTEADKLLYEVMHYTMTPEYLDYALEFTDLETLPERMKNKKSTYSDLLGCNIGWIRLSFITIEADDNGLPTKVIVTTQAIDEEKKREQALIYKSITDELTGISNRRAYEDDIALYNDKEIEDNFIFVSMDVNELKVANDTYGHAAGDELLRGAVACMRQCFGSYGKIYRVGGDEFSAIIYTSEVQLEAVKKDFEDTVACWSGDTVKHMAVSCGYVTKKEAEGKTIQEIVKMADQKMYAAKAEYYRNKGIDRRGQKV